MGLEGVNEFKGAQKEKKKKKKNQQQQTNKPWTVYDVEK